MSDRTGLPPEAAVLCSAPKDVSVSSMLQMTAVALELKRAIAGS